MIRFILLTTLLLTSFSYAQAQKEENKEDIFADIEVPKFNVVKTSPLAMIQGPIIFTSEYRLAVEKVIAKKSSAQISASYLGPSNILSLDAFLEAATGQIMRTRTSGYRLQATYKFYIEEDAPQGWYLAPHISYSFAEFHEITNPRSVIKMHYRNAVLISGWQTLFGEHFAFDLFTALGLKDNYAEAVEKNGTLYENVVESEKIGGGLKIMLGFNIGMAF